MNQYIQLNIYKYWLDFFVSSCIFCLAFYYTFLFNNYLSFFICSIFMYRIGAFTHEICHQYNNPKIKSFKYIWDVTVGCLMLQPSLRFKKPHLQHHTVGIFATSKDPQYPLIRSNAFLLLSIFILLPFIMPFYNFLLCVIPFKNNKIKNLLDKQTFNKKESWELLFLELYYILVWILFIFINYKLIILFYFVSVAAWFLSVLRIPLEHPLNEYKKTSDYKDQEVLSSTHTGILYNIIQPLGLNFHKVHHMHPKVPYYNLRKINSLLN